MTPEHLMLIDLDALGAIRMECSSCHAAFSFRLDHKIDLPLSCFACREPFNAAGTAGSIDALKALMDALGGWSKVQSSETRAFTARLEMSPMMHAAPRPPKSQDRPGS